MHDNLQCAQQQNDTQEQDFKQIFRRKSDLYIYVEERAS